MPVGSFSVFLSVSSGQSCGHLVTTAKLELSIHGDPLFVSKTGNCLVPAVEAVGGSIPCLWRYLGRHVTWLWEGAGGTCLGSCCAWWREAGSSNQHLSMLQWGNSLSCHWTNSPGVSLGQSQEAGCWTGSCSASWSCWEIGYVWSATCMAAMGSVPLPDRGLSLCRTVKACG